MAAAVRGKVCGAKLARLVLGGRAASSGRPAAPTPDGQRQQEQPGKLTRVWQSKGIRNIVLSNPGKRNALSLAMLKSLHQDILRDIDNMDLRVIIISGGTEILFTGQPMTAQDALLHGLISRVVPEDQLESETLKIVQNICQSSRAVLALGKATFYKQMERDITSAYQIASQVMMDNLALKDGQEGIEAFVSKRKPNWFHS